MKVQSKFHTAFKLQGKSFKTAEELLTFSAEFSIDVSSFLKDWFNENTFVEVKTSGSTGDPKIIQLQKKYMINSAVATGEYFKLPEKTTALLCITPNFIAGKMMLVRALILGWHLDVVEAVSNPLEGIEMQYDFSAMVPIQLQNSLDDIHKIKKIIVGGGVVSNDLLQKIQELKTEIFATYGMTETITHIAVKKLNNFEKFVTNKINQSHYQILPNVSITKDERNCLVINAPKVADETITTNDIVSIISSNEFEWLGRYDSIINSGGIKLIPEKIEEKLSKLIKNRFFVAGKSDTVLGEKLILIVELACSNVENMEKDIYKKMKQLTTILKYEIPKEIYFIKNFVETPTKKINRKETLKLIKYTG